MVLILTAQIWKQARCHSIGECIKIMVHPENAIEVGDGNPLQYSCLKILQTEALGGLYSLWGHKQSDMTKHTYTHTQTRQYLSAIKRNVL